MSFAFVFEMALCLFMVTYYFTRKKLLCYMNMRRINIKQQHRLDTDSPANPPP